MEDRSWESLSTQHSACCVGSNLGNTNIKKKNNNFKLHYNYYQIKTLFSAEIVLNYLENNLKYKNVIDIPN